MIESVWVDEIRRPAWQQMALDRAMVTVARERGEAILRLYQWERDSLSLGANEAALRTWDRGRLERDGVPCVRRPTGGRGVWHASEDLTYAWAGPSGGPAGVRRTYRILHERLSRAVAGLGTATTLAPAPAGPADLRPGACFEMAVGGELLAGDRKVLGSAQKVFGDELIQHGAFARADRTAALGRYRGADTPVATSAARSSQETGLPPAEALRSAIREDWLDAGAVEAIAELTLAVERASVEHADRFRDPAWTWRR
jgi:lipoate-protein ligase A